MLTAASEVSNTTLLTIALIVVIVCGAVWLLLQISRR